MHVGRGNGNFEYSMGGAALGVTNKEKDLGVWTTQDCKPSAHVLKAGSKAISMMHIVRRMFTSMDKECFLIMYKTYIRPHLEYCVQVWSPYLQRDINDLERIQRHGLLGLHISHITSGFRSLVCRH